MRTIADKHDANVAQAGLAWLLVKPAITSVLLGATKPRQLTDNLAAADLRLTSKELAELDARMTPAQTYPYWAIDNVQDPAVAEALGQH